MIFGKCWLMESKSGKISLFWCCLLLWHLWEGSRGGTCMPIKHFYKTKQILIHRILKMRVGSGWGGGRVRGMAIRLRAQKQQGGGLVVNVGWGSVHSKAAMCPWQRYWAVCHLVLGLTSRATGRCLATLLRLWSLSLLCDWGKTNPPLVIHKQIRFQYGKCIIPEFISYNDSVYR